MSTTLHIPFAIKPYDPDIERLDAKTDTARTSLEELKKKIIKNKGNLNALKNLRGQLEELEQTLIK